MHVRLVFLQGRSDANSMASLAPCVFMSVSALDWEGQAQKGSAKTADLLQTVANGQFNSKRHLCCVPVSRMHGLVDASGTCLHRTRRIFNKCCYFVLYRPVFIVHQQFETHGSVVFLVFRLGLCDSRVTFGRWYRHLRTKHSLRVHLSRKQ